jgi:flagellar motor switch/type III secretory pathway protein FliN
MAPLPDNRGAANPLAGAGDHSAALPASTAGPLTPQPITAAVANPAALAVHESGIEEPAPEETSGDTRLDRLPMQLDVMVKVRSFRVQDLLAMEKGTVVETVHEHTQDVPMRCGGTLLVWSEFEVLDQRLAVRITRLA